MRKLLALGLLLLVTIALAQPPQVGSLYTRDMSGSLQMTCTASIVSGTDLGLDFDAAILTAAHCIDRGIEFDDVTKEYRSTADYLVTFDEREYFSARLYRVGWQTKGYDLAILYFPANSPDIEPIRIGDWSEVAPGTAITNFANPMGLGLQRFVGYVTMLSLDRPVANASLNWRGNSVAMLPSAGGSSGSLILNEDGEVIGVLIGAISAQRGAEFTVFVGLPKFNAFLTNDGAARSISY
jgi:S1-C subfamily serine protease